MENLFRKMQFPDHCIHTLHPPDFSLSNILRIRGHDFELPRCSLNLHKRSFVISCLLKFISTWTCLSLPTYVLPVVICLRIRLLGKIKATFLLTYLCCASFRNRSKLTMTFLIQFHQFFLGRPFRLVPSTSNVVQRLTQSSSVLQTILFRPSKSPILLAQVAAISKQKWKSQRFSPRRRPPSQGRRTAKSNQLEMVTSCSYRPSLVGINARNFELSW